MVKNRFVTGILFILLGAFIAFGPITVFPVCGVHTAKETATEHAGKMDGHKSGVAEDDGNHETVQVTSDKTTTAATTNKVMKCHWAARAELGIGLVIAVLGLLLIIFRSAQVRIGLSIALGLNGILALLIPTVLIGVCGNVKMTCRSLSLPALVILASMVTVAAAANVFYLHHSNRKGQVGI